MLHMADTRLAPKIRKRLGREGRTKAAQYVLVDVSGLDAVPSGKTIDLTPHIDSVAKDDDVARRSRIPSSKQGGWTDAGR